MRARVAGCGYGVTGGSLTVGAGDTRRLSWEGREMRVHSTEEKNLTHITFVHITKIFSIDYQLGTKII